MSSQPADTRQSMNMGQLLLLVFIICLAGWIGFRYWKGLGLTDYTFIPKEMQINYVPSEFSPQIDVENALAILQNPQRYRREFNDLIYDFNMQLLIHVANRMNLSDSLKQSVVKAYEEHHPYLRNLYYNEFITMQDSTSALYQMWYNNAATNAVDILKEVASKYTCFLVNQIFTSLLKTEEGKIYVKGSRIDTPCGVALTEALEPMMARLKERAAIDDFSRSKGLIAEKVEKTIAELATMEVRDKKALSRTLQTKLWGYSVSSTDLEISAISIIKVGFKLDKFFDVNLNSKSKIVTITMPEPEILSHEVFPKIDKLDIGWMREVQTVDFNKNFNLLRSEFRRDALESDIMEKSEKQAIELMNTMLGPMIANLDGRYKLQIKFQQTNRVPLEEEEPVSPATADIQ